ncbi:unnamed protein product [Aspergillus oryzae]|nr:unnamed protein product [Aspergillus oryzae]GMF95283.1 unnamed protein product [Aspergillus oryzae]
MIIASYTIGMKDFIPGVLRCSNYGSTGRSTFYHLCSGHRFHAFGKLVLYNFALEDRRLEDKLLPWCFQNKLHTLDLDVMFVTTRRLKGRSFMNWLMSKDTDRWKRHPSDGDGVNSSRRDSIQGSNVPGNRSGNDEPRAPGEIDNDESTISLIQLEGESFQLRLSGATRGWSDELLHVNIHLFRWAEATGDSESLVLRGLEAKET